MSSSSSLHISAPVVHTLWDELKLSVKDIRFKDVTNTLAATASDINLGKNFIDLCCRILEVVTVTLSSLHELLDVLAGASLVLSAMSIFKHLHTWATKGITREEASELIGDCFLTLYSATKVLTLFAKHIPQLASIGAKVGGLPVVSLIGMCSLYIGQGILLVKEIFALIQTTQREAEAARKLQRKFAWLVSEADLLGNTNRTNNENQTINTYRTTSSRDQKIFAMKGKVFRIRALQSLLNQRKIAREKNEGQRTETENNLLNDQNFVHQIVTTDLSLTKENAKAKLFKKLGVENFTGMEVNQENRFEEQGVSDKKLIANLEKYLKKREAYALIDSDVNFTSNESGECLVKHLSLCAETDHRNIQRERVKSIAKIVSTCFLLTALTIGFVAMGLSAAATGGASLIIVPKALTWTVGISGAVFKCTGDYFSKTWMPQIEKSTLTAAAIAA